MLYTLTSSLHHEQAKVIIPFDEAFVKDHQVVAVMTGGTESQMVKLVREGQINLSEPVYILATERSNSLAASLEILSWINNHHGHGEVRCCGLSE